MYPTDERDMERADLQMQLAQLGKMVAHLPRAEKLAFSAEARKKKTRLCKRILTLAQMENLVFFFA